MRNPDGMPVPKHGDVWLGLDEVERTVLFTSARIPRVVSGYVTSGDQFQMPLNDFWSTHTLLGYGETSYQERERS